jgi:DNA gyrase subunit A
MQEVRIVRNIEDEMKVSFLDYAMSVIVSRALPDIRDGLKPVHRRILFAMHELGLAYNKTYKKSARIVGDVIGKYHPHGESAVYDALVRMVQDFSLRYPLIDGQGNFGSVDGDPPAAMRYTEARMAKISQHILSDIEKETVDFVPNYDETLEVPEILPAKIPNLLINGSSGIAVGMATNVPPHNFTEVANAILAMLDNPDITVRELFEYIKGPDFPTAGVICGREGIKNAYATGKGIIHIRAKTILEKEPKTGKERIIITELPYQVNKGNLLEKMADLIREKKVEGISDLRDESDRDGMRIVIELKKNEISNVLLNQLFKFTQLQTSFGITLLALVDGQPRMLNLVGILQQFIKFRKVVIVRRTQFELRKAESRAHILEGLRIALDHIDEIIHVIRSSETPAIAQDGLINQFGLSQIQAKAILEMRLSRLTGLERKSIEDEYVELIKEISRLKSILESPSLVLEEIRKEINDLKKEYPDQRRTEIIDAPEELDITDFIVEEDMVIVVTHTGYIKRTPVSIYRAQKRKGQGVTGVVAKEEDFVEHIFIASTHDTLLIITNKGHLHWLNTYKIPEGSRTSKGKAIINLLDITAEEKIAAVVNVRDFADDRYLLMCTMKGIIKKTNLSAFKNVRSHGIIAMKIDEGDDLISAHITDGNQEIFIATKMGKAIRFHEKNVRAMGRAAYGVIAMRFPAEDFIVGLETVTPESAILTVCQNGFGKRSLVDEYRITNRGGKGVINVIVSERNGPVVGIKQVFNGDHLIMITQEGMMIRMVITAESLRTIGRSTQGVKLQGMSEHDAIAGIAIARENDE